jgi:hypothetical protein
MILAFSSGDLQDRIGQMHFTKDRLARLRRSLELALNQEWPQLSLTQKKLIVHHPKPIGTSAGLRSLPVIATVATDGGENRLRPTAGVFA